MKKVLIILLTLVIFLNYNNISFANPEDSSETRSEQVLNYNDNEMWYLSFFVPGLGQMVMGDFIKGYTFMCISIVFVLLMTTTIPHQVVPGFTPRGGGVEGIIMLVYLIFFIVIYSFNILDAYLFYQEKIRNRVKIGSNSVSYRVMSF
jgi:hypothetical protein